MENAKKEMTLNEYQHEAMKTCMPSCNNMAYMLTNLVAEVGEFAGKISKAIRRSETCFRDNQMTPQYLMEMESIQKYAEMKEELLLEAGDILWQLSGVIMKLGSSLEEAAEKNLDKLASRAKRGKIDGNGDHR